MPPIASVNAQTVWANALLTESSVKLADYCFRCVARFAASMQIFLVIVIPIASVHAQSLVRRVRLCMA